MKQGSVKTDKRTEKFRMGILHGHRFLGAMKWSSSILLTSCKSNYTPDRFSFIYLYYRRQSICENYAVVSTKQASLTSLQEFSVVVVCKWTLTLSFIATQTMHTLAVTCYVAYEVFPDGFTFLKSYGKTLVSVVLWAGDVKIHTTVPPDLTK